MKVGGREEGREGGREGVGGREGKKTGSSQDSEDSKTKRRSLNPRPIGLNKAHPTHTYSHVSQITITSHVNFSN